MKISNLQITIIHSTANPVEFDGIGVEVWNACRIFENGGSSRLGQDRFRANGISKVKVGAFINNFIPDDGIERMGTGIRDMFRRCKKAGLSEPEIRIEGGFFVVMVRRKKPEPGAQSGAQSGPSRDQVGTMLALSGHQVEILRKCLIISPIGDLMEIAERTDRTKFRNQILKPLLDEGLVQMTIPDKPKSSKQRYQTTEQGRSFLEQLEKGKGRS